MKLALAIPNCAFDPHRIRSLALLKEKLGIRNDRDECDRAEVAVFPSVGPTPNWVWSAKVFDWFESRDSEWSMLIQDDVLPVPGYWDVAEAAISSASAAGAEAFCFFNVIPPAPSFAQQGCNWLTTSDWMVGPNWVVKTSFMRNEFAEFRKKRLRAGWNTPGPNGRLASGLNEDTMLGLALASYGKKIWHPIPSLTDHDTSVASTYGNSGFAFNRASYAWDAWARAPRAVADLKDPAYWVPRNPPTTGVKGTAPHLGCAYKFTPFNFLRWVHDDGGPYGALPWGERYEQLVADFVRLEVSR